MSTGQEVVDVVRRTIHDEGGSPRWTDAELLGYVNAAQRQIVTLVPEANVTESVEDLGTSRIARQSLPAGGIKFIKVSTNFDDDGTTRQGVVRYAEKDALDTYEPAWEFTPGTDGANYFQHFCHDKREPKTYYLYPPPAADSKRVGVVYSTVPTKLATLAGTLVLGDEYFESYVTYVNYRSLTKESRQSLPDAFRQELWDNFLATLGMKRNADSLVSPEENAPPEAG